MARVARVFFDTSTILAGLVELGSRGAPAQRLLDAVADRRIVPHTAWHCCLEFYSVSTRLPEELRLSPADALRLVEGEICGRFEIHQLPHNARLPFFRLAVQERVAGGRVYDAHIAEIARAAGARTVVTENVRHFSSLLRHGVQVMTARELLEAMGGRA